MFDKVLFMTIEDTQSVDSIVARKETQNSRCVTKGGSKVKLVYRIKPPCSRCPYKLGVVRTVTSPCSQCKANGYRSFERFRKEWSGNGLSVQNKKNSRQIIL